jgi:hypothetical protein
MNELPDLAIAAHEVIGALIGVVESKSWTDPDVTRKLECARVVLADLCAAIADADDADDDAGAARKHKYKPGYWYYCEGDVYVPEHVTRIPDIGGNNTCCLHGTGPDAWYGCTEVCGRRKAYTVAEYHAKFAVQCTRQDGENNDNDVWFWRV